MGFRKKHWNARNISTDKGWYFSEKYEAVIRSEKKKKYKQGPIEKLSQGAAHKDTSL